MPRVHKRTSDWGEFATGSNQGPVRLTENESACGLNSRAKFGLAKENSLCMQAGVLRAYANGHSSGPTQLVWPSAFLPRVQILCGLYVRRNQEYLREFCAIWWWVLICHGFKKREASVWCEVEKGLLLSMSSPELRAWEQNRSFLPLVLICTRGKL